MPIKAVGWCICFDKTIAYGLTTVMLKDNNGVTQLSYGSDFGLTDDLYQEAEDVGSIFDLEIKKELVVEDPTP